MTARRKKPRARKTPPQSHMGLGSPEELGLPYVKDWPFGVQVVVGVLALIVVAWLLGKLA